MCDEPSPGGNLKCIKEIGPDGTHNGGHIWVSQSSGPHSKREEGEIKHEGREL